MFNVLKLTRFLKQVLPQNYPERRNLTELISVITETCVPVRRMLEKGVSSRELSVKYELSNEETTEGTNPLGEAQIHEDMLTHSIFLKAIENSEIPFSFVASEEAAPVLGDGILGITIDPVDGSSNVAVNRTVGTIVGIWLGNQLTCSFYILYGVFTNLVISLNGRVSEFILSQDNSDINFNHFVHVRDLKMPNVSKNGYRCIGGNPAKWHDVFNKYNDILVKNGYKDRYSGSFVGDAHAILYKGGVYGYFPSPKGKLRLYYEWLPIAYIIETLGGKFLPIDVEGEKVIALDKENDIVPLTKNNVEEICNKTIGGIVGNQKSIKPIEELLEKQGS